MTATMRIPGVVARGAAFALAVLVCSFPLGAQQMQRLHTMQAASANARAVGRLPETQTMKLALTLRLRNADQLQSTLQELYTPGSPTYRHFLSTDKFTAQFGPTEADYQKVIDYVTSHGLTVTRTTPNRLVLDVAGTVADIEQTFQITMRTYQHPTELRTFHAPDVEPSVEADIPIQGISGLNDFEPPRPLGLNYATKDEIARANQTGSGPDGFFLGSDMRAAYYGGTALTGAGQAVGLFEFGPYNLSDVQAYFSSVNQPLNVPIVNVLIDGQNPTCGAGCDDGEEVIDIEQAISMAPGLSAVIVYEGGNDVDMFNQMATDNVAKQLSCSFGFLPADPNSDEPIFMEFAAQGQNLFVASGDGGAYFGNPTDCQNFSNLNGCIFYPTDDPFITAAGGTNLTTNGPGGSWQSETGWIGSGGGFSTNGFAIPSYQVPVINSTNQGSTTLRNIPDVAAEANTDNYFCANGGCFIGVGGTSLSAPRWAGFMALANEQANGEPVGSLNPAIYSLGQSSNYNMEFHDITSGNNFNGGSPSLFSATTGYDLVTGWGSPNGQGLLDALGPAFTGPNFTLAASPSTVLVTQGNTGTTTASVSPVSGFTGTAALKVTVLGSPAGVTASISPSSITGAGTATLSISTTSETPGGNFQIVVSGTSGSLTQTAYVTLELPGFTLTPPSTVFLNQRTSASGTFTIVSINGFSGTVAFSVSGVPKGVTAVFRPSANAKHEVKLDFTAGGLTATGLFPLTITGTSGNITQSAALNLAVSAATGTGGAGMSVNLSPSFNVSGIYTNGTKFSISGGLDGGGAAYSANVLTPSRVLDGARFNFGPANAPNGVTGATVSLPVGSFGRLGMLATGVQGNQFSQTVIVTYTDGSSTQFTQSFSDWFTPQHFPGEGTAVVMPHRNIFNGTVDNRIFNLYAYIFRLDNTKTVQSITLPNNRNVIALAITLTR